MDYSDDEEKEDFLSREFTCSKLTIEALEQGVKYVQNDALVSLLLTLNIFLTLF